MAHETLKKDSSSEIDQLKLEVETLKKEVGLWKSIIDLRSTGIKTRC